MNEKLTEFFQRNYNWIPPWERIKLVENGWFIPLSEKLSNAECDACLWAPPNRQYEIHYKASSREKFFALVIAHELTHVWQSERESWWFIRNATEQLRVGYKRNKYEIEANEIMKLYYGWAQTNK